MKFIVAASSLLSDIALILGVVALWCLGGKELVREMDEMNREDSR